MDVLKRYEGTWHVFEKVQFVKYSQHLKVFLQGPRGRYITKTAVAGLAWLAVALQFIVGRCGSWMETELATDTQKSSEVIYSGADEKHDRWDDRRQSTNSLLREEMEPTVFGCISVW